MTLTLLPGHCLTVLPTLPAESVQTVVTSPPYYGLRAYGTPPQVWGGMADCQHIWNELDVLELPTASAHFAETYGRARFEHTTCLVSGCGAWRGELGQEPTLALYLAHLVSVFAAVRRVLRPDGTLWVNLGDSYSNAGQAGGDRRAGQGNGGKAHYTPQEGLGPKQLLGVPWRFTFAMQDAGWILRADIIWHKPNAMPESVTDRPTKAHEYLFLFARQPRYYYDAAAIAEPSVSTHGSGNGYKRPARLSFTDEDGTPRGSDTTWEPTDRRNRRSVWIISTSNFEGAHFATFPPALVRPCILAGSRPGDTVLDPFSGTGTVCQVATVLGRNGVGIDLQPTYITLAEQRTAIIQPEMLLDAV